MIMNLRLPKANAFESYQQSSDYKTVKVCATSHKSLSFVQKTLK